MFKYNAPEDDVIYIETCRDLLYDPLYVLYMISLCTSSWNNIYLCNIIFTKNETTVMF
jgi:hypothetical protein